MQSKKTIYVRTGNGMILDIADISIKRGDRYAVFSQPATGDMFSVEYPEVPAAEYDGLKELIDVASAECETNDVGDLIGRRVAADVDLVPGTDGNNEAVVSGFSDPGKTCTSSNNGTPFLLARGKMHPGAIYYLDYYYPYHDVKDAGSPELFRLHNVYYDLKRGNIESCRRRLSSRIGSMGEQMPSGEWSACAIPPHTAGGRGDAVCRLLEQCGPWDGFEMSDLLERTVTVEKNSTSRKARYISTGLDSMKVNGDVCGKNILVFDDITTSGCTLDAADLLLRQAGASKVICVALARTVGYVSVNGERVN